MTVEDMLAEGRAKFFNLFKIMITVTFMHYQSSHHRIFIMHLTLDEEEVTLNFPLNSWIYNTKCATTIWVKTF